MVTEFSRTIEYREDSQTLVWYAYPTIGTANLGTTESIDSFDN